MTGTPSPSPELLQAQVAYFAARHGDPAIRVKLMQNVGDLATGLAGAPSITDEAIAPHADARDKRVGALGDLLGRVGTVMEFIDFVHSMDPANESVHGRAKLLEAYPRYAPTVEWLKGEVSVMGGGNQNHPGFLGEGKSSAAYRVVHEGTDLVVRLPHHPNQAATVVDNHLSAAVRGKVQGLERIIAASYESGVTVAEPLPITQVARLTIEDIRQVTDGQLSGLVDTLLAVGEKQIDPDLSATNFLYDPAQGFGIVDCRELADPSIYPEQYTADMIGWAVAVLMRAGTQTYGIEQTIKDFERNKALYETNRAVMYRYRAVVEQKLSGKDRDYAVAIIDVQIAEAGRYIRERSNSTQIARLVAEKDSWKRRTPMRHKDAA